MVNKYVAGKSETGYKSNDCQSKAIINLFPIKKLDLSKQWNGFVNRIIGNLRSILSFVSFISKNISSVVPKNVI